MKAADNNLDGTNPTCQLEALYGQGCLKTAVIAVIPPVASAGEPPTGFACISQADQLPSIRWSRSCATPSDVLVGHNLLFEAAYLICVGIRPLWPSGWDCLSAALLSGSVRPVSIAVTLARLSRVSSPARKGLNWFG